MLSWDQLEVEKHRKVVFTVFNRFAVMNYILLAFLISLLGGRINQD